MNVADQVLQEQIDKVVELSRLLDVSPNRIVQTPWGGYVVTYRHDMCRSKMLVVWPGHRTSLQRHKNRYEAWTVVSGLGVVDIGPMHNFKCEPKMSFFVNPEAWHRVACVEGRGPLVVAETWVRASSRGSLSEDDIERKEDDYGRVAS